MTDPESTARSILGALQAAADRHDADALEACFAPEAVLIGTGRFNDSPEQVREYLALVMGQAATIRWDLERWSVFLDEPPLLGVAAEGAVVATEAGTDLERSPFRLTIVAAHGPEGWRIVHFHGSTPDT